MSWRRGFLRVWIVLSVVWIGFVGFLAWDAYQTGPRSRTDASLVPGLCADIRGEAGADYGFARTGVGPWDRYKGKVNPFDTCWTKMSSYRRLWPDASRGRSDTEILAASYAGTGETPERSNVPSTYDVLAVTSFALGIPVAVLAIGAVFAWVLSGFSRPAAPKPPASA